MKQNLHTDPEYLLYPSPRWSEFGLFQRDPSSFGVITYLKKKAD